jgi:hypothetical protein
MHAGLRGDKGAEQCRQRRDPRGEASMIVHNQYYDRTDLDACEAVEADNL